MKKWLTNNFRILWISVFLSLLFLFPVLPFFFKGIPYTHLPAKGFEQVTNFQGDHLQWLYHLALLDKSVRGKIPWFSEGFQFSTPYQFHFLNLYFPPQGLLFWLFSFLGYAGAYNTLVFLAFFISLTGTFAYLNHLNISFCGALGGAIVFTFFPYRVASLYGGHPAGMMISYIPWLFLLFEKTLDKKSFLYSVGAGFLIFCFACSEPHYYYYLFLFFPFYFIYKLIRDKNGLITFHFPHVSLWGSYGLERLVRISGLIALFTFFLIHTIRRSDSYSLIHFSSSAISALLTFIVIQYLFLIPFSFKPHILKNPEKALSPVIGALNILYLYSIQLFTNIPHLGSYIAFTFIGFYGFQFFRVLLVSSPGNISDKLFTKNTFKFSLKNFLFLLPLILFVVASLFYTFHIKSSTYSKSTLKSGRDLSEVKIFSPSVSDLATMKNKDSSKYVYLGILPLILLLFLAVSRLRSFSKKPVLDKSQDIDFFFAFLLFIFSLILCFGPNFPFIPLYSILRKVVPYFDFIRSPIKIILFTSFSLAILSGLAIASVKKQKQVFVLFLLTSELFFLHKNIGINFLHSQNQVLTRLSQIPKEEKVLFLPIWPGNSSWSSLYQYYSLFTERFMIGGYQPAVPAAYIKQISEPLYPLNFGFVHQKEYELLQQLNVKYLVFHKEAFPRKVSPFPQSFSSANLLQSNFLEFIAFEDPLYLFKVCHKKKKNQKSTISCGFGFFHEGEHFNHATGSKIVKSNKASLKSTLRIPENSEAVLEKFFPSGEYSAFLRVKKTGSATFTFRLSNGPKPFFSKTIPDNFSFSGLNDHLGEFKLHPVSFTINDPGNIRFGIVSKDSLELDYIYIIPKGQSDPKLHITHLDGIYTGTLINEEEETFIRVGLPYNPCPLFFGPNRLYAKGSYHSDIYLKGKFPVTFTEPIVIEITDTHGIKKIFQKKISADSFNLSEWQKISIDFTLPSDQVINFHIIYPGTGELCFKEILIKIKN